jgi:hypothetical protein
MIEIEVYEVPQLYLKSKFIVEIYLAMFPWRWFCLRVGVCGIGKRRFGNSFSPKIALFDLAELGTRRGVGFLGLLLMIKLGIHLPYGGIS